MNGALPYALAGVGLMIIGAWALVLRPHLVSKVLAANILSSGVFVVLVAAGTLKGGAPDPVPRAMVITGIVVAVSVTALALALVLRIADASGKATLPEDRDRDLRPDEAS